MREEYPNECCRKRYRRWKCGNRLCRCLTHWIFRQKSSHTYRGFFAACRFRSRVHSSCPLTHSSPCLRLNVLALRAFCGKTFSREPLEIALGALRGAWRRGTATLTGKNPTGAGRNFSQKRQIRGAATPVVLHAVVVVVLRGRSIFRGTLLGKFGFCLIATF
jgi:hypothetical protein